MFRLNLKIALRNLWKNKGYTLINIIGLSIGLSVFCVILLFVNHETRYDHFDGTLDRAYRLYYKSGEKKADYFPYLDAELIKANEPNVEAFTRIESPRNDQQVLVEANDQSFYLNNIIKADPNFFEFFSFKLLRGDKKQVFAHTNSIVLTKAISEKIFGSKDPLNQVLKTKDIFNNIAVYTVTGIIDEQSGPSHLAMNACLFQAKKDFEKTEGYQVYNIYLKLKPGANRDAAEKRITGLIAAKFLKNNSDKQQSKKALFTTPGDGSFLESVQEIHLRPRIDLDSNLQMVRMLSLLAVCILLLVCINFTNLLVARSFRRAKEVGIRKVLGAQVPAIMGQFISEVVMQAVMAFLLGMAMMEFMLPAFNQILDMELSLWSNPAFPVILTQILVLLLFTILLTGGYPAWYLSRFQPSKVLKGDISRNKSGNIFRSGLLVLQFAISVLFLSGMLLVKQQVNFIKNQDPGFNGEQVIAIKAQTTPTVYEHYDLLKNKLVAIPGVVGVSKTTFLPGSMLPITLPLNYKGEIIQSKKIAASAGYFDVMKIPMVQGRVYTGELAGDTTDAIVLNEAAVKALNIKDPIGKMVLLDGNKYDKYINRKIIGVVKDVNMQGFETSVPPAFYVPDLMAGGGWQNQILLRLESGNVQQTMEEIKRVWAGTEPGYPMNYVFVDEEFNKSYQKYIRLSNLFNAFTLLSVAITIIGLLALVALITAQRTKEIGIRKVLGASSANILVLLNKSFFKLVLLGNLIALPVIYILMKLWLSSFAYRMDMPVWPYLAAISASLVISAFTVTLQALKAIKTNPVDALKYE